MALIGHESFGAVEEGKVNYKNPSNFRVILKYRTRDYEDLRATLEDFGKRNKRISPEI